LAEVDATANVDDAAAAARTDGGWLASSEGLRTWRTSGDAAEDVDVEENEKFELVDSGL